MRERFQKHGAALELSLETKTELGVTEPTQWTIERMKQIQNRIAEPLVLYWYDLYYIFYYICVASQIYCQVTYLYMYIVYQCIITTEFEAIS